jgi:hypothetical protein
MANIPIRQSFADLGMSDPLNSPGDATQFQNRMLSGSAGVLYGCAGFRGQAPQNSELAQDQAVERKTADKPNLKSAVPDPGPSDPKQQTHSKTAKVVQKPLNHWGKPSGGMTLFRSSPIEAESSARRPRRPSYRASGIAQEKREAEVCLLTHKSTRCLGLLGFPSDPVHKGPLCLEADFHLSVKIGRSGLDLV